MKQFSFFSRTTCLTATLVILTVSTFAQNVKTTSTAFDTYEHVNGNELIKKMILAKHELNKNRNAKSAISANFSAPQYILNRDNPTVISFDGLDYLVQNNCVLAVKGLNLSDDALSQITEKLCFLDQVQFDYHEKINRAYCNGNENSQKIRNLNKWYLLTLRIISTTVNDFASLAKKYDAASFAKLLVKLPVPNLDAVATPTMAQSVVRLAK
ncbi:hypothetical protein EV200_103467 [Pedobacter psychrotolerans]|uniref:Uncharacterized protein n=1 Tax=Pedobacter psychrotolerans TaxID=1843235 RepID=A0A4R2HJD3_9SPHI|nr:hypothetical protein [Pedobacter psychrotolerans]TCO27133.1 hypothetical protein EV200_103467 [Pedobacter psychrotolerans]GGE59164.1 hypothetical protein GCM10011413_27020 [Pedobacter psychrotolerans]